MAKLDISVRNETSFDEDNNNCKKLTICEEIIARVKEITPNS